VSNISDQNPERPVAFYAVRYKKPGAKKWETTRWKMTEEEAAKRFAGQEYELVERSKEIRRIGGDWLTNSTGNLYRGFNE